MLRLPLPVQVGEGRGLLILAAAFLFLRGQVPFLKDGVGLGRAHLLLPPLSKQPVLAVPLPPFPGEGGVAFRLGPAVLPRLAGDRKDRLRLLLAALIRDLLQADGEVELLAVEELPGDGPVEVVGVAVDLLRGEGGAKGGGQGRARLLLVLPRVPAAGDGGLALPGPLHPVAEAGGPLPAGQGLLHPQLPGLGEPLQQGPPRHGADHHRPHRPKVDAGEEPAEKSPRCPKGQPQPRQQPHGDRDGGRPPPSLFSFWLLLFRHPVPLPSARYDTYYSIAPNKTPAGRENFLEKRAKCQD